MRCERTKEAREDAEGVGGDGEVMDTSYCYNQQCIIWSHERTYDVFAQAVNGFMADLGDLDRALDLGAFRVCPSERERNFEVVDGQKPRNEDRIL